MFMFLQRTYLIPALPGCLAVRSAQGRQAEFGVGVNLNKLLSVHYLHFHVGVRDMEESCCIYHRVWAGIAGDEDFSMEYDFMFSPTL